MAPKNLIPLIVVVGETASGKSGLAIRLAKKFNGEIINADSWAVYKEFDVGTAKPTKKDRLEVLHHLIDVTDPNKGFSAAEFKKLAQKAIDDISSRGKISILVGGTGLYIDSLIYDYGFLPAGPSEERRSLDGLSIEELLHILRMKNIDTTGIDLRNKRRLVRLIESGGVRPAKSELRANTLIIGVNLDGDGLERRISKRVDQMIANGLEAEVKQLVQKYGWLAEPMKGIGYREWQKYFAQEQTLEQTREQIIIDTLHLAKKQRTWFKRNNSIHWISSPSEAIDLVTTFLNT